VGGGWAAIALRLLIRLSGGARIVEWDTVALLTGVSFAGATAVLSALGPSSRAARVDPNTVLRAD
jgi:ABC-type antimicrobial peptide transport system permease subunit